MLRASKPAADKIAAAAELEEIVNKAQSILLADFTGMSVAEFDELRTDCFKNEVVFRVAKNRLAKIVFEKLGFEDLNIHLTGPTGFCFGFDDPIVPIKLITSFIDEHKKPIVKGCLVEGQVYGPEKVDELKKIPPRQVLIATIVGGVSSPLSGFVIVLNEIVRSFVGIIDAIAVKAEAEPSEKEGLSATGGSVQDIIESIEKMTVLELVELKKALEEKFDVTAAAPVAMAGPVAAGGEAAAEVEEQTEFTVVLTAAGDKKIQVIKEVRAITSLGLKEAKALVDEAPKPIKEGVSKDEAMSIKTKIEEAGGQVEMK